MRKLILGLAFSLLFGCSSYGMNITTNPVGASLYWQNGAPIGSAPHRLNYEHNQQYMDSGCFRVSGVTARWTSGATAHSPQILRLCNGPGEYHLHLERPASAPGLQADLNVAQMLVQQRLVQEQMLLDQMARTAESLGAWLATE